MVREPETKPDRSLGGTLTEWLRESAIRRMKESRQYRKHLRRVRRRVGDPNYLRESLHGRLMREASQREADHAGQAAEVR